MLERKARVGKRLGKTPPRASGSAAKRRAWATSIISCAMRTLRREEEWARHVLHATLGVPVEQNDDGSEPGMHDLKILYPNAPAGAVEVTAAVDAAATELWNLAYREGRWEEPDLAGGWRAYVDPTRRSRKSKLRRDLPAFLRALERAHIQEWPSIATDELEALARRLGLTRAHQGATDFPGSIYVFPDLPADQVGGFGSTTGDALACWASDFLNDEETADVREKLRRSGAVERHAFVIVATLPGLSFAITDLLLRDDAPMPTGAPALPLEITDVWIVSAWAAGLGFRWSPASGWRTFAKLDAGDERASDQNGRSLP